MIRRGKVVSVTINGQTFTGDQLNYDGNWEEISKANARAHEAAERQAAEIAYARWFDLVWRASGRGRA